jgi:hypothetical protein
LGQLTGAAASFAMPGGVIGNAARAGRFGSALANFTARAGGRGAGALARQSVISGATGGVVGGAYGYNSATGPWENRLANVPLSAGLGALTAGATGPMLNAAARIPTQGLARAVGFGRPAGAPRLSGHTINALDRSLGASGDDVAGLSARVASGPPGQRLLDVADVPAAPAAFRAQYETAGGAFPGSLSQRARRAANLTAATGGGNAASAAANVATHNVLGLAGNAVNAASRRYFRAPIASASPRENLNVLDALESRLGSARVRELLRILGARERGRISRGSTEAFGEGFGNASFSNALDLFGDQRPAISAPPDGYGDGEYEDLLGDYMDDLDSLD